MRTDSEEFDTRRRNGLRLPRQLNVVCPTPIIAEAKKDASQKLESRRHATAVGQISPTPYCMTWAAWTMVVHQRHMLEQPRRSVSFRLFCASCSRLPNVTLSGSRLRVLPFGCGNPGGVS